MPSIHFKRWLNNIDQSKFEVYWFDILKRGKQSFSKDITQLVDWESRKIPYIKGEYFVEKNFPYIFSKVDFFLRVNAREYISKFIEENNIDIIHSFEMQSCTYPLEKVLMRSKKPWIYSCWGSDIFFYRNFSNHRKSLKKILGNITALQTDNIRDINLAKKLGFKSRLQIILPGGGGYDIEKYKKHVTPYNRRNIILIKGYQHKFGRALNILQALERIESKLFNLRLVIFGAHSEISSYAFKSSINFEIYMKGDLSHKAIIELMNKSIIYIGNSISDGIPNTLLEAFLTGAYPIQSNPGGVTEEIISDKINGCLINDPLNISDIANQISWALDNKIQREQAIIRNRYYSNRFDKKFIKKKINHFYQDVLNADR
ncbi:MAG TPA: glycosyltransferase [Leeuwenhoekiella sp.]|nr:glycosyltransferase [Leeuwenhoekiella sp.]